KSNRLETHQYPGIVRRQRIERNSITDGAAVNILRPQHSVIGDPRSNKFILPRMKSAPLEDELTEVCIFEFVLFLLNDSIHLAKATVFGILQAMMTAHKQASLSEFVGVGSYTAPEAARLLKTSPRNINRWLGGYTYRK